MLALKKGIIKILIKIPSAIDLLWNYYQAVFAGIDWRFDHLSPPIPPIPPTHNLHNFSVISEIVTVSNDGAWREEIEIEMQNEDGESYNTE